MIGQILYLPIGPKGAGKTYIGTLFPPITCSNTTRSPQPSPTTGI
ncbi:hypothetical protein [Kovacikia minuta]|nr:hypothetical protein [Kovacikia minuta]